MVWTWKSSSLWPAEKRILAAAKAGQPLRLYREWDRKLQRKFENYRLPLEQNDVPTDFHARGEFFVQLLGRPSVRPAPLLHPRGIELSGIVIVEPMNFESMLIEHPIWIANSLITSSIVLRDATTRTFSFQKSRLFGINAHRACIRGPLFFRDSKVSGLIDSDNADVQGTLIGSGSRLRSSEGPSVFANQVKVGGSIQLDKIDAKNRLIFSGATVGSAFALRAARLRDSDGNVLEADGMQVGGNLILSEGFDAKGGVSLAGTTVRGQLGLQRGRIQASANEGLNLEGASISKDVFLGPRFYLRGCVRDAAFGNKEVKKIGSILVSDYFSFHSFAFAIDTFVPVVRFHISEYWHPDSDRGVWSTIFKWFIWIYGFLGWVFGALFVATISGLLKRE